MQGRKRASLTNYAALAFVLFWVTDVSAQRAFTEAEVVDRVLQRFQSSELTNAEVEVVRAEGWIRSTWDNPEVEYDHEAIFDHEQEQTLTLTQEILLGGERSLWRSSGDRRAEATRLRIRSKEAHLAAQARRSFFQVLWADRQVQIFEGWLGHLEHGQNQVKTRLAAGDATALDGMRAAREIRRAMAEHGRAMAEKESALARLEELVGEPASVSGTLMPSRESPEVDLESVPNLAAFQKELEAVGLDLEAAGRTWVPSLKLTMGLKRSASTNEIRHGFVAAAGLSLPFFDHGQWVIEQLHAEREKLIATRRVQSTELRAEWMARAAKARQLRATAIAFRGAEDEIDGLVRATQAGYEGGELDLWQLLEAYRGQVEDQQTQLALEMETTMAEITVDELRGRVK